MTHVLEREQLVSRPRSEVFAYFSDAANLEALTPGSLSFSILTPLPVEMGPGALIDYRLKLFGVPMQWRTRIEEWKPEDRFVDVQLEGPYRLWRHLHTFEDRPEGTLMRDRVEYALPLGPLGWMAHRLFVARQLDAIFSYRRDVIARVLG